MGLPCPSFIRYWHFTCLLRVSSLCNIHWSLQCKSIGFTNIICSPSPKSLRTLLLDSLSPISSPPTSLKLLVKLWRFALQFSSLFLQCSTVNHTNKRFCHDHKSRLQAHRFRRWYRLLLWSSKYPALFPIRGISLLILLCHRLDGKRTCMMDGKQGLITRKR